jgi:hypothetical protein
LSSMASFPEEAILDRRALRHHLAEACNCSRDIVAMLTFCGNTPDGLIVPDNLKPPTRSLMRSLSGQLSLCLSEAVSASYNSGQIRRWPKPRDITDRKANITIHGKANADP